jgi:hypothetical protein
MFINKKLFCYPLKRIQMNLKIKLMCLLGTLLFCDSSFATPTYFVGSTNFPPGGGPNAFYGMRNDFQSAALNNATNLALESFEGVIPNTNSINFTSGFTASLISGLNNAFSQVSGNFNITTDGNAVLSFGTTGSTAAEFAFNSVINAFGIDITSIDQFSTQVSFLDDVGNVLNDFAYHGGTAGATFFGVYNNQAFRRVRFDFAGTEALNFDRLQFGTSTNVPEPETLALLALGVAGLVLMRRRISA